MELKNELYNCRPRDYLTNEVFPTMIPALNQMLKVAKVTEKRKRFNPLDFLVEYLYKNNPRHSDRQDVKLEDIPFVQEEWKLNPRPPLPLSATLSELEAVIIIQAFGRGIIVRRMPEVVQFRNWQKGFRKEIEAASTIQRSWRRRLARKNTNVSQT